MDLPRSVTRRGAPSSSCSSRGRPRLGSSRRSCPSAVRRSRSTCGCSSRRAWSWTGRSAPDGCTRSTPTGWRPSAPTGPVLGPVSRRLQGVCRAAARTRTGCRAAPRRWTGRHTVREEAGVKTVSVPPADHGRPGHPNPARDLGVRHTLGSQQHDPRSLCHPRPSRRRTHQRVECLLVTLTQHQRRSNRHTLLSRTHTVKSLTTRDARWVSPSAPSVGSLQALASARLMLRPL
jgi:hypothetical protein